MRRDFLKELGIEDKAIIDKILDENSADIGRAKGETDDLKAQIKQLEGQLSKKTSEFDELKESTKDYSDLGDKIKQLELEKSQLTTDKAQLTLDLDKKVAEIQKTHAIENGVRDAKAKNIKSVMALLDVEKITYKDGKLTGLDEQLEPLKTGEDTSFLFGGGAQFNPPVGTHLNNPPSNGGNNGGTPTGKTLAEAIAAKFKSNQ